MTDALITLQDVGTVFGDKVVHRAINLEVRPGEVLALIGGSGSGKTTLLRHMTGLTQPSSGSVTVFGETLDNRRFMQQRGLRQRWGVLFQFGALFSSLSVRDNVMLPLLERGGLEEDDMESLMQMRLLQVGLQPTDAERMPAELSGGMVKRVALARALILDPQLLFLDEPTSGLDPVAAGQFVELILELKRLLNLTAVMVTHDLERMRPLCDRVAVLADQTLVAVGSFDEVSHVQHPFITEYFGKETAPSSASQGANRHGK